jgi:hypothetical protein
MIILLYAVIAQICLSLLAAITAWHIYDRFHSRGLWLVGLLSIVLCIVETAIWLFFIPGIIPLIQSMFL